MGNRGMRCSEKRASALHLIVFVGLGFMAPQLDAAANYPTKAVTIIVPFSAGGSADVQARPLAKGLSERLGKPVVVDNRPGAGGSIGLALAARAAADGYTLLYANFSMLVSEPILRYDSRVNVQRDFAPITLIAEQPLVLVVSPTLAVKNLDELLTQAAKRPGKLSYASWGPGTAGHLFGEMFKAATGVQILHVPYKGHAPAITDMLGAHVSMMFAAPLAVMPHIRAGKLKALAMSGHKRLAVLPEVPTFGESGLSGLVLRSWSCLMVPAKTPAGIIARLHKETVSVLKSPEFARLAENDGAVVLASSPKDLMQRIETDSASLRRLLKTVKLDLDE